MCLILTSGKTSQVENVSCRLIYEDWKLWKVFVCCFPIVCHQVKMWVYQLMLKKKRKYVRDMMTRVRKGIIIILRLLHWLESSPLETLRIEPFEKSLLIRAQHTTWFPDLSIPGELLKPLRKPWIREEWEGRMYCHACILFSDISYGIFRIPLRVAHSLKWRWKDARIPGSGSWASLSILHMMLFITLSIWSALVFLLSVMMSGGRGTFCSVLVFSWFFRIKVISRITVLFRQHSFK